MKAEIRLTAPFEEAEEGSYIAYIEELKGVDTQGGTLDRQERIWQKLYRWFRKYSGKKGQIIIPQRN